MPIYEYECDLCHRRFERLQKLADPVVKSCPSCGGPVHKQFSVPALQFKGSGFYATDYAHRSTGASSSSVKSETKGSGSSSGGSKSV